MINIVMGYVIFINIVSMIFMYVDMKNFIKISEKNKNFIYIIMSILGGSIGILITSQMLGYKYDEKIIKRGIPFILFIEIIIIGYLVYKKI